MALAYNSVWQRGYSSAEQKYTALIEQHNRELSEKITALEKSTITLVNDHKNKSAALQSGISNVLKATRDKPMTIIQEGECVPSPALLDSINRINAQTNQVIRGTK